MIRTSSFVVLAVLAGLASIGRAGCLAPSDTAIDASAGSGTFWGNDAGSLLYARVGFGNHATLTLRDSTGSVDPVAVAGDSSGFFVGTAAERWDSFQNGSVNATGDIAFVATTKLPDDTSTPQDESVPRRGAYARSTSGFYEIARFGNPSPIRDVVNTPIPWGSVFEAAVADRDASGYLNVVFSAQLAGSGDSRLGIFRWNERTPGQVTTAVLTGDFSPAGGNYSSIGRVRGDGAGDVAFFGVTQLTAGGTQTPGIFVANAAGAQARVVKFGADGDAAPGGGTFSIAGDFDIDAGAVVTFASRLQGGAKKSGLFRARPPLYAPELIVSEADPTPLSGTFGGFSTATVRANASGDIVFSVPLSDDVGGDGLFTVAANSTTPLPLVGVDSIVSIAAIGAGRAAYSTETTVHVVAPSDGSQQGPTDYRIVAVDLRNLVPLNSDSLAFSGRFLLPPWDVAPPAAFRGDATRFSPTQSLTGAALTKIVEAKVFVSSGQGSNFVFDIAGADAAPTASMIYNGSAQAVKKLTVKSDGSSATWTWAGNPGPGSFTVDLAAGTFKLAVSRANLPPSYEAADFRLAFILRSADDVAQARPDAQSYFWKDFRINAKQPNFPGGRRVTSAGENVSGGTLYVDSLRVARAAAAKGKPASDTTQLSGTLRLCPGTVAIAAPRINATVALSDFHLDGVVLSRVGKKGTSYRYVAKNVDLRVNLAKATFSLKATSAPLASLASAVSGSATNGPEHAVGGMKLPFTLSIPLVYEATYDVAMTRLAGGKTFTR